MGISKMDYRDILGLPKKKVEKKVAPKPTAPPVTELLKNEFGPLNEWTSKPPTEKRWSKNYNGDKGLTEFEQRGGKDNLNERNSMFQTWQEHVRNLDKLYLSTHHANKAIPHKKKELQKIEKHYKELCCNLFSSNRCTKSFLIWSNTVISGI